MIGKAKHRVKVLDKFKIKNEIYSFSVYMDCFMQSDRYGTRGYSGRFECRCYELVLG